MIVLSSLAAPLGSVTYRSCSGFERSPLIKTLPAALQIKHADTRSLGELHVVQNATSILHPSHYIRRNMFHNIRRAISIDTYIDVVILMLREN
jgi:hypothetical protein